MVGLDRMTIALGLCITLAQLATLAVIAPFLTDLECAMEALFTGRHGPRPGWRWRQIRTGWHHPGVVPASGWMALCATGLACLGVPYASTFSAFGFLSEPLACGILLILSCVPVWAQAQSQAPTRMIKLRNCATLAALGQDLIFLVPLLALTGTLITIGLPGSATLDGLLQQRLLQPAPALLGGLVFVATAVLLILNRGFLSHAVHEGLSAGAEGRHRSLLRYRHDLSCLCWYLLVADLVWPDSIATVTSSFGHLAMLWCVAAPAKLAVLVILATGWRVLRPLPSARLALVLSGAAILLVLAGRIAS